MTKKLIANIYRSQKKDEMYLYVAKTDLMSRVPQPLLDLFGRPVLVTTMLLTEDKPLARAQVADVISDIEGKGFFLQMPPVLSDDMRGLAEKNSKLSR